MQRSKLFLEGVIPVNPEPKGRPRIARGGFAYTPAKTRKAEAAIALVLKTLCQIPCDTPCALELELRVERPLKPSNPFPYRFDLDNAVKLVSDAANGILFIDDRQIVEIQARKLFQPPGAQGEIIFRLFEVIL